jgi:hypothetical protein
MDAGMTTCRCERCCPDDPAPTYTRAFLIERLARDVAALPTLEERRAWLDRWYHRHGADSTRRLKDAVRRVWIGQARESMP